MGADNQAQSVMDGQLAKDLRHVINCHCCENGSNTPDFILANYLIACLQVFDAAVNARTQWYAPPKDHTDEPTST